MIIKKLRLQRGWSQEQLSLLSGLSTRTIQRIEKGQNPGLESLKSLAAVFETSVAILQEEPDMNTEFSVSIEERLAFERVRKIKDFYQHLIKYCMVVPILFAINFITSPGYVWAFWPMLGWGIGLAAHGIKVFSVIQLFGPDWEKRQVEKQLNRKL
ncbi:helix-turn-helix domain-containing protein [Marinomonas colpomeniae]|uniref:Helix-turn-helix domain-containing protein n=1 Tax=Marinomonas colpomeniae TaxID=2774408 RepID=A0ABR8NXE0_9GAMM|nr:helix-turn-helix domain-containing protein [Marinomonas colpomeniae]MBD5770563.1 helix-turn-helix domain-containing protein [Marinomonas colpomeniae]